MTRTSMWACWLFSSCALGMFAVGFAVLVLGFVREFAIWLLVGGGPPIQRGGRDHQAEETGTKGGDDAPLAVASRTIWTPQCSGS